MMKKIEFIGLSSLGLVCGSSALAASFMITPKVSFPSTMYTGTTAMAEYNVVNTSGHALSAIALSGLGGPLGMGSMAQMLGPWFEGSAYCPMAPFSLAKNGSCILAMKYLNPKQAGTMRADGPKLCPDSSGFNCSSPPDVDKINTVVSSNQSSIRLTASAGSLTVAPNMTSTITVTNTSTTSTANGVMLHLEGQANAAGQVDVLNACPAIAPGKSCDIQVKGDSTVWLDGLTWASIGGSNTLPSLVLPAYVSNVPYGITSAVVLTDPAQSEAVTFTNESQVDIKNISLVTADLPSGITVASSSANCTDLPPKQDCVFQLQATNIAHGISPRVRLNYSADSSTFPQSANITTVSVQQPTVLVNGGNDITTGNPAGGSFTVENTGNFAVQNFAIAHDAEDSWLALTDNCPATLMPETPCTINYTFPGGASPNTSSVVFATGTNIQQTPINFYPADAVSIGRAGTVSDQHMQYGALSIRNGTSDTQSLSQFQVTLPAALTSNNKVQLCSAGGTNCPAYTTTSVNCANGTTLSPGNSCYIWLKANKTPTAFGAAPASPFGVVNDTVAVSVDATNERTQQSEAINRNIATRYMQAFYANYKNDTVDVIEAWNGATWSALPSDPFSDGNTSAMADFLGDLNDMTLANGVLARFDGVAWRLLSTAALDPEWPNSGISGVGVVVDSKLYYSNAGYFSLPDVSLLQKVAAWDGTEWAATSQTNLRRVANFNGKLAASGYFWNIYLPSGRVATPETTALDDLAIYDPATDTWSGLGQGGPFKGNQNDNVAPIIQPIDEAHLFVSNDRFANPPAFGNPEGFYAVWDADKQTWSSAVTPTEFNNENLQYNSIVTLDGKVYASMAAFSWPPRAGAMYQIDALNDAQPVQMNLKTSTGADACYTKGVAFGDQIYLIASACAGGGATEFLSFNPTGAGQSAKISDAPTGSSSDNWLNLIVMPSVSFGGN